MITKREAVKIREVANKLLYAFLWHKSALGEPYWANVHTNLENLANSWKIRPKRQNARRRGTVAK